MWWGLLGDTSRTVPWRARVRSHIPFRVNDDDIIVGGQGDKGDGLLHAEGLAGAGHAQDKSVGIEELLAVADQEVLRYGVDAAVDTPRVWISWTRKGIRTAALSVVRVRVVVIGRRP